jgi:hypothetical protein
MNGGGIERRAALVRLAALLPFAALGLPQAKAHASVRAVAVPGGWFRLDRFLVRELSGGGAILVTRQWRIGFAQAENGMTVTGAQIAVEVAAPPALGELAELERSRSASEIFPLTLDSAGLIRSAGGRPGEAALVRALETGRMLIQALPLAEAERYDARRFLAELAGLGAGAVSRLPRDLLFPRPGRDSTMRDIALPGGETGSILVTASASAAAGTGLLIASERQIVTRVGDSARRATERWSLHRL